MSNSLVNEEIYKIRDDLVDNLGVNVSAELYPSKDINIIFFDSHSFCINIINKEKRILLYFNEDCNVFICSIYSIAIKKFCEDKGFELVPVFPFYYDFNTKKVHFKNNLIEKDKEISTMLENLGLRSIIPVGSA